MTLRTLWPPLIALCLATPPRSAVVTETPLGTKFTYQAQLKDGGVPANGRYDLQFRLYDAEQDGTQLGTAQSFPAHSVSGGLFTVRLDFGTVFTSDARWIEADVRSGGNTIWTTLAPRHLVTPAPVALYALDAPEIPQAELGHILYPISPAEQRADLSDTDLQHHYYYLDPRRYGALPDDGGDDTTALQIAINVADLAGGGTVQIHSGTYKTSAPLNMLQGVSLIGSCSTASIIEANDTDAISYGYVTGFGNSVIRCVNIEGINGTTRTAIIHPGTNDDADELYGITVENVLIRNFNVGIHFRTVRNFTLLNNWIQDINRGIELIGKNLLGYIAFNKLSFASGNGSGPKTGILLNSYTYTDTSQIVRPEGIQILNNQMFGFDQGIDAVWATYINIIANDISARVNGIAFQTVELGLSITDNFVEMRGAGSLVGIIGHGLGNIIQTQVNIERNRLIAVDTTRATGIQINDDWNQNQNYVNVVRNFVTGFDQADILIYAGGVINIENNLCQSADATYGIHVVNVVVPPVYVDKNYCPLSVDADEVANGEIILGRNVRKGTGQTDGQ